jgi:hypothetical protein
MAQAKVYYYAIADFSFWLDDREPTTPLDYNKIRVALRGKNWLLGTMAIGVKKLKPGKKGKPPRENFEFFPLKKDFLQSKNTHP